MASNPPEETGKKLAGASPARKDAMSSPLSRISSSKKSPAVRTFPAARLVGASPVTETLPSAGALPTTEATSQERMNQLRLSFAHEKLIKEMKSFEILAQETHRKLTLEIRKLTKKNREMEQALEKAALKVEEAKLQGEEDKRRVDEHLVEVQSRDSQITELRALISSAASKFHSDILNLSHNNRELTIERDAAIRGRSAAEDRLTAFVQVAKEEEAKVRTELTTLRQTKEDDDEEFRTLKARLARVERELKEESEKTSELEKRLETRTDERNFATTDSSNLKTDKRKLRKAIIKIRQQLGEQLDESRAQTREALARAKEAENMRATTETLLTEERNTHAERIRKLEEEVRVQRATIAGHQAVIDAARAAAEAARDAAITDRDNLALEIAELVATIKARNERIEICDATILDRDTRLDKFSLMIRAHEATIAILTGVRALAAARDAAKATRDDSDATLDAERKRGYEAMERATGLTGGTNILTARNLGRAGAAALLVKSPNVFAHVARAKAAATP